MNTAERRWVLTASAQTPDEWDQLLFRAADFPLEAIVEHETTVELYFVDEADAAACAQALGLDTAQLSEWGTGEVFGQSSHPTTELCLELMPETRGKRVADIGSGTGRLAAEAARLGAALTVAVDPDWPAALETKSTLESAPSAFAVQSSTNALATGAFDLILANLHLSLWRELASEVARIAAPNAQLVAGGFLEEQAPEVNALMVKHGWRTNLSRSRNGWLAVSCSRSV